MRVLRKTEIIVQARGEEMIDASCFVPPQTRNDIVDMVRNLERNAVNVLVCTLL